MMDLLQELKQKDYDKYLAVLLSTPAKRETLAALFLYAHEISQIPVEVSEPMIGLIKLQWWKDVLDEIINKQPARPHPILKGLVGSQADFTELQKLPDNYADLLEGKQPKTLEEVETFLVNTDCVILNQAAKIAGIELSPAISLSYALSNMARRLVLNSQQPAVLIESLIKKSQVILPKSKNVFAVISEHYNKCPKSPNWHLVLKLLLKQAQF